MPVEDPAITVGLAYRSSADLERQGPYWRLAARPRCEQSGLPRDVDANVCKMSFIEYPPLVLRMPGVLLTEVVPNHLAWSLLVYIAKFASELGGFVCSHASECKPHADHATRLQRPESLVRWILSDSAGHT